MNVLESLIAQQVNATVVSTISHTTDTIAEEMAREIMKDPDFRARMKVLITRAFEGAFQQLEQPSSKPE
jgi:hypothetical protein